MFKNSVCLQGKVEPKSSANTRNEVKCTWWNATKTEIIASAPNIKFTDIKNVDENPRDTPELIGVKPKEDTTTEEKH